MAQPHRVDASSSSVGVLRWIDARVAESPEATALIDGARSLSYRELDVRANALAHELRARGVDLEDRVGVCCEPSIEQVVAVLAVLKAGAAYVPLDREDPRMPQIVANARLAHVLGERDVDVAHGVATAPAVAVGADNAIYILYTSGSTGEPKGVVGLHRAITNRLAWQQETYPYQGGEVACARTPLGFVDSVAELFAPLAFGVPLVIIDRAARRDPRMMIELLARHRVTRIVVVPSLLATMLDLVTDLGARVPALRYWFIGGEPVPPALVTRFFRAAPGRKLINIYGSTEVSGDATYFDFDRMPAGLTSSPIGVPLSGVDVRLVDDEIWIAGACLARGYLDRDDPRFVELDGTRYFRMGDLGRRLPGGDLQYLGRIDSLVKIRGMRVELGEVEARMLEVPGVVQAAVIAREQRLDAFYAGSAAPEVVRGTLARRLPSYMVPSQLVPLAELPLNGSRKIDRRALAAMPIDRAHSDPPASECERRIARVWESVFDQAPIGRSDNFYDLGGTSLTAVRIAARLREQCGLAVAIDSIFSHPTIAQLAQCATEVGTRAAPITASQRALPARLRLSHYQFPFWLFRAVTGDVSVVSDAFGFTSELDIPRLQRAFSETVSAFDTLWMHYPRWRPVQQPTRRRPCSFEIRDRRRDRDDEHVLAEETVANNTRRFTQPPHVHARLVLLPSGDHRLLVAMPHIAVDMTAFEMFRARLERAYLDQPIPEATGASLVDLVEWEHREHDATADLRYWQTRTGGNAWNSRPTRFAPPREGSRALTRQPLATTAITAAMRRARDEGSSLPMAMINAIAAGVREALERDDLTLSLMIEKRDRAELADLFTTMTALMPVRATTADLRDQLLASYAHTDYLMRIPTLWNDSWASAPRAVRRLLERAHPLLARYLFALVPYPGRDGLMICVNILPEVYQPEPREIVRRRRIEHILRPTDFVIGSDPLLDRTLQIHVTREDGETVVNLYGGGIAQHGLDEIGTRIARAFEAAT